MTIPLDHVLTVLRRYPAGVTTSELAAALGMKPDNLCSRLSKTHLYGGPVDREVIRRPQRVGGRGRYMLWRAR